MSIELIIGAVMFAVVTALSATVAIQHRHAVSLEDTIRVQKAALDQSEKNLGACKVDLETAGKERDAAVTARSAMEQSQRDFKSTVDKAKLLADAAIAQANTSARQHDTNAAAQLASKPSDPDDCKAAKKRLFEYLFNGAEKP